MRYFTLTLLTLCCVWDAHAQTLSLDSCRAMALRNNRQLAVGKVQQDIADNIRKSARTKYLPKVSAIGGYELMSKQLSLLSATQQGALNNIGSSVVAGLSGSLSESVMNLVQQGVISPETAMKLQQEMGQKAGELAQAGNAFGQTVTDAFKTDTRQMFAGAVMVTQPIYMGGAITAANKMADLRTNLTDNHLEQLTHQTLYDIDHTYWLVVSLAHKLKLAQNFNKLIAQLKADVDKMIAEGVATRAEGLKVAVKLNESEVALTQAQNGLALAKMLLCQRCGLPLDSSVKLADEDAEIVQQLASVPVTDVTAAIEKRPEIKCLNNMVDMTRQVTKLTRAAFMPQVVMTGGYLVTNPNVADGFHRSFVGLWNVGVILRVPVWNWGESTYKIRAAKAATVMAELEMAETKEKIELQISQESFKVSEAEKRLLMARQNIRHAEENMRCANLGFREGVISSTDVIGAQTAWFDAQSRVIDAEIDLRMSQLALMKAMGEMN